MWCSRVLIHILKCSEQTREVFTVCQQCTKKWREPAEVSRVVGLKVIPKMSPGMSCSTGSSFITCPQAPSSPVILWFLNPSSTLRLPDLYFKAPAIKTLHSRFWFFYRSVALWSLLWLNLKWVLIFTHCNILLSSAQEHWCLLDFGLHVARVLS